MSIVTEKLHRSSSVIFFALATNRALATSEGGFNLGPITQFGCTFINTLLGPFAVFYSLGIVAVGFTVMGLSKGGYGILVKALFVAGGLLFTAQIVDSLSGNRIQTLLAEATGCTIIGM
jgi:type IV secretory pathway VirB2 component (pilin)